jgi:photosystem II stability/assembly factor-like uncharacterized protein
MELNTNNSPITGGASVASGFNKIFFLVTLLLFFISFRFQDKNTIGWEIQYPNDNTHFIVDIKFLDTLNGYAVTDPTGNDSSYFLKTTNGGANWNITQKFHTKLYSLSFPNLNTGYVSGIKAFGYGVVYKTTNAGINWTDIGFGANPDFVQVHFTNPDTGWVIASDAIYGGTYKTTNGGISWTQQMSALTQISFVNANTGWGFANNQLYRTTNSGQNWVNIFTVPNSGSFFKISFLNDSVGFISASGMSQNISKTTNGGFNWTGFANPDGYSNIYFLNENYVWLGCNLNKIKVVRNAGTIIGVQTTPNFANTYFSFRDTTRGWAAGSGIIHTTDGGGPITDIGNNTQLTVTDYKLYQNYPNPFNPVTTIKFDIKKNANVTIKVFDIRGREVSTPLNGYYTTGEYELRFDGSKLTSGVYFYQLAINGERLAVMKMILTK